MNRELFSRGGEARVFSVSPEEKEKYPSADLVREQREVFSERATYRLYTIAHALFPNNFIHMVGYEHGRGRYGSDTGRYFSEKAPVPDAHAVFSLHSFAMEFVQKIPGDSCASCQEHREFHKEEQLEHLAAQTAKTIQQAGLFVPIDDPTDYCLSPNGIIFFELDLSKGVNGDALKSYAENANIPYSTKKRIRALMR